ncbi:4a-hydroxytetrahydrobiopterin dehydratase [Synechococcus sp. UW140]|uniref:4a-hydroxytetrahydrobiopterin dehydratase n=1 Tax=Synechococcus sp. UW140 TaxID=368503 RepID=UPI000E0F7677|nr:4a-hydroxytetrahydrobiopterin dehydratase [Synechococcus sp. UW140]
MATTLLNQAEIQALPQTLPQWQLVEGRLERHWTFADFVSAWGFMSQVALLAEAMNHHPNWSNVYSRVTIQLSTHDLGGLSNLDLDLARAIDALS